ncbi:hypothetical protein A2U01_0031301, partial [Trifolium medium]|nr:hypothetical protein [Trifolium medium]
MARLLSLSTLHSSLTVSSPPPHPAAPLKQLHPLPPDSQPSVPEIQP